MLAEKGKRNGQDLRTLGEGGREGWPAVPAHAVPYIQYSYLCMFGNTIHICVLYRTLRHEIGGPTRRLNVAVVRRE